MLTYLLYARNYYKYIAGTLKETWDTWTFNVGTVNKSENRVKGTNK